ncbi:hypothetical protein BDU57DRAFT_552788 [Ampelomyces quisqualis]|uniref:FAD-binding PCMH-type domain-containing protein n=1 Tax=Ampelomyces quisqualis TaxID=50730 RepID=A0A6A5QY65_AMPQU|nr:hypothetical protein BDU57DRAFT_552788 [Ampelomyces quisqualis]
MIGIFALLAAATLPISQAQTRLLSDYNNRLNSYFDMKQQGITGNCIVQPRCSNEVSLIVKSLFTASILKPYRFVICSGGHTPYAGASNIENGVTIDLQYISAVNYDAKNSSVKVRPGATWDDSSVGVGGLTLGGGISYFSPEQGLISDNVLEFEVTSHPDLFMVLKRGNNNFGIVTSFQFRMFSYDGMWGGLVIYPETAIHAQFKALINFANNIEKNLKGAAIVMPVYQSAVGADLILNAYDYPEPVWRPAAYNEFVAIPGNISDTTGLRNVFPRTGAQGVMTKAHKIYLDVLAKLKAKVTGDWEIYVLYQPQPPSYWQKSLEGGGNVLGLERFNGQVLCLYQPYISWQGAEQDKLFQKAGADLIKPICDYAESIGADNPYLCLDYADNTQDPLKGYGEENVKKMKAAAKKYDPFGVFQNLVPGDFKISKVD